MSDVLTTTTLARLLDALLATTRLLLTMNMKLAAQWTEAEREQNELAVEKLLTAVESLVKELKPDG